jgi:hypothetical protein
MNKRVILIQGPSTYVDKLKSAWSGYDIIWSTWIGEESKYSDDDIVVYCEKPRDAGVQNLALQHKTTLDGIKKAKELGYSRVLKWRSDLEPKNPDKLISLFDENSLNFLAWHTARWGYFVDYFMEGKIDDVLSAWDIDTVHGEYSEHVTTKNILSKFDKFNFVAGGIDNNNEVYWIKKNINLSIYKNHKGFKLEIDGK